VITKFGLDMIFWNLSY